MYNTLEWQGWSKVETLKCRRVVLKSKPSKIDLGSSCGSLLAALCPQRPIRLLNSRLERGTVALRETWVRKVRAPQGVMPANGWAASEPLKGDFEEARSRRKVQQKINRLWIAVWLDYSEPPATGKGETAV